jgi:integral membrane protein (TIGR00529 family)
LFELLGVIAAFVLIMVLGNRRFPLGPALLAASLVLGVVAQRFTVDGAGRTLAVVGRACAQRDTLELALVVALITVLSRTMRDHGLLDRTVESLAELLGSVRLTIAAVPGLVGCLPVIGGAIVSCPMVDSLGDKLDLSPQLKSAANLVFRHSWFFVFPFMPAMVVAAKLAEVDMWRLIRMQIPITALGLLFAYWYLFRGIPREPARTAARHRAPALRLFLLNGGPLLFGLILGVGLPVPGLGHPLRVPLHVALGLAIAFALFVARKHPAFSLAVLYRGIDWKLVLTMFGLMSFKAVIKSLSVVPLMVRDLVAVGIPIVALYLVIPFLVGFVTANHSSTVAVAFPLLLPLLPPGDVRLPYVMLAFVSSYLAYFASPLHLCQILTLQYFKTTAGRVFPLVLPVLVVNLVTALITFIIIRSPISP